MFNVGDKVKLRPFDEIMSHKGRDYGIGEAALKKIINEYEYLTVKSSLVSRDARDEKREIKIIYNVLESYFSFPDYMFVDEDLYIDIPNIEECVNEISLLLGENQ